MKDFGRSLSLRTKKKRRLFLGVILRRVAVIDERRRNVAENERNSDRFEKVAEKAVHLSGILISDELSVGFQTCDHALENFAGNFFGERCPRKAGDDHVQRAWPDDLSEVAGVGKHGDFKLVFDFFAQFLIQFEDGKAGIGRNFFEQRFRHNSGAGAEFGNVGHCGPVRELEHLLNEKVGAGRDAADLPRLRDKTAQKKQGPFQE